MSRPGCIECGFIALQPAEYLNKAGRYPLCARCYTRELPQEDFERLARAKPCGVPDCYVCTGRLTGT